MQEMESNTMHDIAQGVMQARRKVRSPKQSHSSQSGPTKFEMDDKYPTPDLRATDSIYGKSDCAKKTTKCRCVEELYPEDTMWDGHD